MSNRICASFAVLLVGGGLTLAQAPPLESPPSPTQLPNSQVMSYPPALSQSPVANAANSCPSGGDCGNCCCPAPANYGTWATLEYLGWWMRGSPVSVPLVTTTTAGGGTPVLLGQSSLNGNYTSGIRGGLGGWLDQDRLVGVEGGYFYLDQRSSQSVQSTGTPVLYVPFFTPGVTGVQNFGLASPGAFGGGASLAINTLLQGAEVNGLLNLGASSSFRLDGLVGFRWVQLQENLTFATNFLNGRASGLPGGFANTIDQFNTSNNFYGGQIGLRGEYQMDRFVLKGTAKVAFGDMNEVTRVNGSDYTNIANTNTTIVTPRTIQGGIFSQTSNIGGHVRDRFAVIPEFTLSLGYQLSSQARVMVGYNFLYISEVLRPGNQIDNTVNFSQSQAFGTGALTGAVRPAYNANSSYFWAHGITAGFEFQF